MQIPQEWREVLSKVQEVFPTAVIAGGALRDLEYNRPVKDVDIFIPVQRPDGSMEEQEAFIITQMQKLDMHIGAEAMLTPVFACPSNAPLYFKDMKLDLLKTGRWVENVQTACIGDTQFEFIFAAPETLDISLFDFSICQISYDGITVRRTPAYLHTQHHGIILYNHDYRNPKRAADRIARMKEKFPDMELLV